VGIERGDFDEEIYCNLCKDMHPTSGNKCKRVKEKPGPWKGSGLKPLDWAIRELKKKKRLK